MLGLEENFIKIIAIAVFFIIGCYGYLHRILDKSGVVSGIIVGTLIIFLLPIEWFAPFIALFFIGGLTAKYKYDEKEIMGIAERKEGRSVKNILANCGAAFVCVLLYALNNNPAYDPVFLAGYLCALTTAASDSAAAEIGQLSGKRPILITTLKPVKTGTDGAISLLGEITGLIVAMAVAIIPLILGVEHGINYFIIGTIVGFLGCHVDSLVGATLELRGTVGNHGTNLIATTSGAIIGMVLFLWFFVV